MLINANIYVIIIQSQMMISLNHVHSKNVYKYVQKDSFHCPWYLKISLCSNMFKCDKACKQKCVCCDQGKRNSAIQYVLVREKNHIKTREWVSERNAVTTDECFWKKHTPLWCAWQHCKRIIISINTNVYVTAVTLEPRIQTSLESPFQSVPLQVQVFFLWVFWLCVLVLLTSGLIHSSVIILFF